MNTPQPSHETADTAAENTTESGSSEGADPGLCPWCTAPITPQPGRGRPKVWCSDQCRRDAHTARKAARAGAVGMQVIRQTRTVEKPVKVPVIEYRYTDTPPTQVRHVDPFELLVHVMKNSDLLARILDSFAASIRPRSIGRQLPGPLHKAVLRLAPLLDDYVRRTTPTPGPAASTPDTSALSRQQRRALQRREGNRGTRR
ncbi:hypothetical protein [Rhodococcus marinonascens]|uniref:hypothetical protein n=1 Tax=Rhodococcus marinonascens TaxID=38311 RepID=UPI000933A80A|nr:hypothetical protein [Rhodococcus marinonascens]